MNKLAALKMASDLFVGAMEALITVQKINAMAAAAEGRELTDADWEKVAVDTKDANDKLAAARKAAGFI